MTNTQQLGAIRTIITPATAENRAILRANAQLVTTFDAELRELVSDLTATLAASRSGIGLAAPQIGVSKAVCVVDRSAGLWTRGPEDIVALINPFIRRMSGAKNIEYEMCLSIPGIGVPVSRIDKVEVEYCLVDGSQASRWADGIRARAIQHEVDHLAGRLIVDHLPTEVRAAWYGALESVA